MARAKKPDQEAMRAEARERMRDLPVETEAGRLIPDTGMADEMDPEMEPGLHQREQMAGMSKAAQEQMAQQPQIKHEAEERR
jgi:hypothetical protein